MAYPNANVYLALPPSTPVRLVPVLDEVAGIVARRQAANEGVLEAVQRVLGEHDPMDQPGQFRAHLLDVVGLILSVVLLVDAEHDVPTGEVELSDGSVPSLLVGAAGGRVR